MPTVPRVAGPTVQEQGIPNVGVNVHATPEDFGASAYDALGRAANQLGNVVINERAILRREEEKNNVTQVMDARNQLHSWENDWFDPNNAQGVRAYQGKDALSLQSAMAASYKQKVADLQRGLMNEEQRRSFTAMAGQYGEQVRSKVNNYAYAENAKYQQQTFEASLSTSSEIAASAARDGDMPRAMHELEMASVLIDQNAKFTGEPPELVAKRKQALLSQTTLAGVNGMVSAGRVDEAATFWTDNQDQMTPKDRIDAAKAVTLGRIQANPRAMSNVLSMAIPRDSVNAPATPIGQIRADAREAGVSPMVALAIADIESGINPAADNPRSTAGGLFQLLDASWQQYAGDTPRGDVAAQSKAGVKYIADSQRALREALGRQPEPHELYMAHLFGKAGAQTILRAPDDTPIIDVVKRYDPKRAQDIVQNNGMGGMTVGEVKDKWRTRMGRALEAVEQIPDDAPAQPGDDARRGELGTLHNPNGSISTEISITVTDPELNGGRATNIPLLVKGQVGVDDLQNGSGPTDEQQRIAINRAITRVKDGASLPSFDSISDAEKAAAERSAEKGRLRDGAEIIAALPIENRIQLSSMADSEARKQQAEARAGLTVKVANAKEAFVRGEQPAEPVTYDQFASAYGPIEAAREFSDYRGWQQFGSDVGQLKTMPSSDMQRWLESRRPASTSENYADSIKRFDALAQAAGHVLKARQEDPIQAAMQAGGTSVQPLDMSNPQSLPDQLALREAGAKQVAVSYGTPLRVFSKSETTALLDNMNKMTPTEKIPFLRSMQQGMVDPAAFGAAMAQIAPDQPVVSVAAKILQKQDAIYEPGSFPWYKPTLTNREDVASMLIKGDALLNPQADDRKTDGKAKPFPMPAGADERAMREAFNDYAGTAFKGLPTGYQYTYQAARAYYASAMAERGDYSGSFDSPTWDRAIKAATGGVTDFNNRGQVVLPYGMPEYQFDAQAEVAFGRALAANGMPADKLSNYGLQTYSEGKYIVTTGAGALLTPSGQKVVIDLSGGGP